MKSKTIKSQGSQGKQLKSIRITSEIHKKLEKILFAANKKKFGRKIRAEQVLDLSLNLLVEKHIFLLQEQSLTNEDKTEQLRQGYISKNGPITHDGWLGFMMTSEFQRFLAEQSAKPEGDVFTIQSMTKVE